MRFVLLLSCLLAALCGSAGFMLPGVARGRACNRSSRATEGGMHLVSRARCQGLLPTATAYPATSGLRMSGGGEEGDGGGSDGSALAEARIVVHGQATGGYFRAHARNEAHFNRKLCGALKELDQGETEIIVEGKTSAIRSFLRWCRKGPGLSQRIEDVTVDWSEYTGIFDGFEIFPDETSRNKVAGMP